LNPVCVANRCVPCTQDASQCTARGLRCDSGTGRCIQCASNAECSGAMPICGSDGLCRGCAADGECAPLHCASTGRCVPCASDANCAAPTPACDPTTNTC